MGNGAGGLRRGRRVRRQEGKGSSEHQSVRGRRHAVLRKFRLCVRSCVCAVPVIVRVARKSSRKPEPLLQLKATSSRETPLKAYLQDSVTARCLDVDLHSLVLFLIDGFVFAMPDSKARMNPTAHLHVFAERRHIRERSASIDADYDLNKSSA